MGIHYYEIEIEDLGALSATVEIEYDLTAGEPAVMYFPNGDGYPGSDPTLEVIGVTVTGVSGPDWDMDHKELEALGGDGSWGRWLDAKYLEHAIALVDSGEWLVDHLFEHASDEEY